MALVSILNLAIAEEEDRNRIKRKIIRPERFEAFDYPDNEFVNQFRLNKKLCCELIEKLRPALEARTSRRNAFSAETKVFCALRFYAEGSYQRGIANDICNSMSQASVSNFLRQVTTAINELLFDEYITFPVR